MRASFDRRRQSSRAALSPAAREGDVAFDTFVEFGNANAYAHAGYVFVEEDGVMQRFSVNDSLELVSGWWTTRRSRAAT